jgi:hypothetical protein
MRLVPSPSSRPLSHWLARAPWVLRDLEKEEGAEGGRVERKAGTKCGGRDRPFKGPGERLGTLSLTPRPPHQPPQPHPLSFYDSAFSALDSICTRQDGEKPLRVRAEIFGCVNSK